MSLVGDYLLSLSDETLDKRKIKVMAAEIAKFVDIFKKIKNINLTECKGLTDYSGMVMLESDIEKMSNDVMGVYDYIKSDMKMHVLLGFSPIGIMLRQVLMGKKSKTALNNARANAAAISIEIEKMETEKTELEAVRKLAKQVDKVLRKLIRLSRQPIELFGELVKKKQDWNEFIIEEKKMTAGLMSLIKLIKMIIDQPVINSDGIVCEDTYKVIEGEEILRITQKGE